MEVALLLAGTILVPLVTRKNDGNDNGNHNGRQIYENHCYFQSRILPFRPWRHILASSSREVEGIKRSVQKPTRTIII